MTKRCDTMGVSQGGMYSPMVSERSAIKTNIQEGRR